MRQQCSTLRFRLMCWVQSVAQNYCCCSICHSGGHNHNSVCFCPAHWKESRCCKILMHVPDGGHCGIYLLLPHAHVSSIILPFPHDHTEVGSDGFILMQTMGACLSLLHGNIQNGLTLTHILLDLRRLVTSRTSINQLLILRLVVHPTIWSILILQFSNTVRHIGKKLPTSASGCNSEFLTACLSCNSCMQPFIVRLLFVKWFNRCCTKSDASCLMDLAGYVQVNIRSLPPVAAW